MSKKNSKIGKKTKVYQIHDNYNRPFNVEVKGDIVSVSKNINKKEENNKKNETEEIEVKHLFTKTVEKIFIGIKSPKGGYDGLTPSKAEGNSILLKIDSKYLYIGSEIYQFSPVKDDVIIKYYSNIGRNDVPYPYAIGKTHIYIMLDKVAVEKSYFDMKKNIYEQYYYETKVRDCLNGFGDKNICKDMEFVKERLKEFNNKKIKLKNKMIEKRNY